MSLIDILKHMKQLGCFPKCCYCILNFVNHSYKHMRKGAFLNSKLVKSYLRSTITQERLNELVTIVIESDVLEQIKYEYLIQDFISRNIRRMLLFSRT
jgi:hypothetical protein